MPFTPSHVAAILPLRGRAGVGLPLAALAAGSLSPDLPYFLPIPDWRVVSPLPHSLMGILTWDLLFGLVMWTAWRLGAGPLHDLAPDAIRRRWRPAGWPTTVGAAAMVVLALLIGAGTHVLWDSFTHAGRFGTQRFPILNTLIETPLRTLPAYRWLQYLSGVVGLVAVAWVGLRQPMSWDPPRRRPGLARAAVWLIPLGALVAVVQRFSVVGYTGLRDAAFAIATASIAGAVATTLLLCLLHAATTLTTQLATSRPGR